VTNAIAHTGTMITLVAACTNGQLVVSVRDDDIGGRNLVAAAAEATAESGRGLELVATIAGTWGMTPHADGKSVWFRLP
jgi:signal transduction histidine kinase